MDLGLDAQQRLLPRRPASRTGKVRQDLVEALAERAPTEIIALPPIVGAELELTVGVNVKRILSAPTEWRSLPDDFCFLTVLPASLGTEFRIGLFNCVNLFGRKVRRIDDHLAIPS